MDEKTIELIRSANKLYSYGTEYTYGELKGMVEKLAEAACPADKPIVFGVLNAEEEAARLLISKPRKLCRRLLFRATVKILTIRDRLRCAVKTRTR